MKNIVYSYTIGLNLNIREHTLFREEVTPSHQEFFDSRDEAGLHMLLTYHAPLNNKSSIWAAKRKAVNKRFGHLRLKYPEKFI